jgi:hypothetical protein
MSSPILHRHVVARNGSSSRVSRGTSRAGKRRGSWIQGFVSGLAFFPVLYWTTSLVSTSFRLKHGLDDSNPVVGLPLQLQQFLSSRHNATAVNTHVGERKAQEGQQTTTTFRIVNTKELKDLRKKKKTKKEKKKEKKLLKPVNPSQLQQLRKRLGTLTCDKYGGPSLEKAREMVYWQDIPSDAKYVSPFRQRHLAEANGATSARSYMVSGFFAVDGSFQQIPLAQWPGLLFAR